mgnify:FL=1
MIILFGPAGSGKSTQGKILAKRFGWKWLSVGQTIRDTGKFSDILQKGELVDDQIVIDLMKKAMDMAEADGMNVILDGYPRDVVQAKWMAENMAEKIEGAIIFDVPEEELWKRIEIRGRSDDVREVVKKRFDVFWDNIHEIVPILTAAGISVKKMDGTGELDEVTERLALKIEEFGIEVTDAEGYYLNEAEQEQSYGE